MSAQHGCVHAAHQLVAGIKAARNRSAGFGIGLRLPCLLGRDMTATDLSIRCRLREKAESYEVSASLRRHLRQKTKFAAIIADILAIIWGQSDHK
jgi:hypothetical protein